MAVYGYQALRRHILLWPFLLCAAGLLMPGVLLAAPPHLISHAYEYDPDWLVVESALTTKCIGCHRANTERADLTTYDAVVNSRIDDSQVVVPFDAEGSTIWECVVWNASGDGESELPDSPMMPPDQDEWFTVGQLEALYRWIQNGALEFALPSTCDTRPVTELDFPSARVCAQCHPRQYDEWSGSMHAYAMHSPIFEAFNLTLVERTSGTIGTFCTRCHSPIGTALGENGSRRNVNRSRISTEGVTCVVCHRRSTGHYKNNGRLPIEPGRLHEGCFYGPFESTATEEFGTHPSQSLPYIKTSQFCGECHDVVAPNGVRNEEAFSEWQRSPAAKEGITCQNCHMGPIQGIPIHDSDRPVGYAALLPGVEESRLPLRKITDHSFAGPDYSLLPDTEFPRKLDWMYEVDYRDPTQLTPHQQATLRELRRENRVKLRRAAEKRYQLLHNAARITVSHPQTAGCGERIRVRVDVQSLFGGHHFPTGFTAERQVWVSIEVRDSQGQLLFVSGDLDHNQDLRDEHSHEVLVGKLHWDRHLLNFQNKFTALTNRGTERFVSLPVNRHLAPISLVRPAPGIVASFGRPAGFRIAKGSLPPLREVGRDYPVQLPESAGTCLITARLNFRHLPPSLLDHIGTPHLKHLLEVVVIDEYQGTVQVAGPSPQGFQLELPWWSKE